MSANDGRDQFPSGPETTLNLGGEPEIQEYDLTGAGPNAEDKAAIAALPRTSALLIMERGPGAGSRFLLDGDITTAGRAVDADIFLDDVTVSRKHVEFVREGTGFLVRDVGSLNGTYLNRQRIESAILQAGDEVQIGKYRLTFHPSPNRNTSTL